MSASAADDASAEASGVSGVTTSALHEAVVGAIGASDPLNLSEHTGVVGGGGSASPEVGMNSCLRCGKLILANSSHAISCEAITALDTAARKVNPAGTGATVDKAPPPAPKTDVVVAVAVSDGHVAKRSGQAPTTAYASLSPARKNSHSSTGDDGDAANDNDDENDGPQRSRPSSITRGPTTDDVSRDGFPREMPELAHASGSRAYPLDDAKRIISCYNYVLAASALVFIGCLVGATEYGTAAYEDGLAYWTFGDDVNQAKATAQTVFRAPVAACILAAVYLFIHAVWHVCVSCLTPRSALRKTCLLHIGHMIAAEYDPVEALLAGFVSLMLYPLLAAVIGERDWLRFAMLAALVAAWQLCLYCSDYFASPARQPASNASQFYVAQRARHRGAFWLAAFVMQAFVYTPILVQAAQALPDDDLNPAAHVALREVTMMICLIVDILKAIFSLAHMCSPSAISKTGQFVMNKVFTFVTFSVVVLAASFL